MEKMARELVERKAMVSWRGGDGREILKFVQSMSANDFRELAEQERPDLAQRAINLAQWLEYRTGSSTARLSEVVGDVISEP